MLNSVAQVHVGVNILQIFVLTCVLNEEFTWKNPIKGISGVIHTLHI